MTLSAGERRIRHTSQTSSDGLLNVTETLHALFVIISTPSSRSGRIFGLRHSQNGVIYNLNSASTAHLDLSAHSVVDAHKLPLNQSVVRGEGHHSASK